MLCHAHSITNLALVGDSPRLSPPHPDFSGLIRFVRDRNGRSLNTLGVFLFNHVLMPTTTFFFCGRYLTTDNHRLDIYHASMLWRSTSPLFSASMAELTKPPKCAVADAGDALDEEAPGGISNMRALTASKVRNSIEQMTCFTFR